MPCDTRDSRCDRGLTGADSLILEGGPRRTAPFARQNGQPELVAAGPAGQRKRRREAEAGSARTPERPASQPNAATAGAPSSKRSARARPGGRLSSRQSGQGPPKGGTRGWRQRAVKFHPARHRVELPGSSRVAAIRRRSRRTSHSSRSPGAEPRESQPGLTGPAPAQVERGPLREEGGPLPRWRRARPCGPALRLRRRRPREGAPGLESGRELRSAS